MKKKLLFSVLMAGALSLGVSNAQTVYGPSYFAPVTEDFEGGVPAAFTPGTLGAVLGVWDTLTLNLKASVDTAASVPTVASKWYYHTTADFQQHSILDDATFEDFTLEAKIYPGWGNKTGLIFNYQDADNFYVVEHWAGAGKMYLREIVDGIWDMALPGGDAGNYQWAPDSGFQNTPSWETRIAFGVTSNWFEGGTYYNTMKVKNDGESTSVWFNDSLIFDNIYTDMWLNGKVGFYTNWNNLTGFDDLKVSSNGVTAISDQVIAAKVIYPSIVRNSNFTVETRGYGNSIRVQVMDMAGRVAINKKSASGSTNVNVSNLKKGVYIMKVSGTKEYSGKLVIQ